MVSFTTPHIEKTMIRNSASVYQLGCSRAKEVLTDRQTQCLIIATFEPTRIPLAGNRDGFHESLVPKSHLNLSHKLPPSPTESQRKQHSDVRSETDEALVFTF